MIYTILGPRHASGAAYNIDKLTNDPCNNAASTTTQTGLTVQCRLDENTYEKGTKVSDAQMDSLNITSADFHGEWNYTIAPRKPES